MDTTNRDGCGFPGVMICVCVGQSQVDSVDSKLAARGRAYARPAQPTLGGENLRFRVKFHFFLFFWGPARCVPDGMVEVKTQTEVCANSKRFERPHNGSTLNNNVPADRPSNDNVYYLPHCVQVCFNSFAFGLTIFVDDLSIECSDIIVHIHGEHANYTSVSNTRHQNPSLA